MEPSNGGTLPDLPASDSGSLQHNSYDAYYGVRARDFWGPNQINTNEVKPFQKCDHFFEANGKEIICKKCHMGLLGPFEIRDGKLFHKGEAVGI